MLGFRVWGLKVSGFVCLGFGVSIEKWANGKEQGTSTENGVIQRWRASSKTVVERVSGVGRDLGFRV